MSHEACSLLILKNCPDLKSFTECPFGCRAQSKLWGITPPSGLCFLCLHFVPHELTLLWPHWLPVFHTRFLCSRVLCVVHGVLLSGTRIFSSCLLFYNLPSFLPSLTLVQVLFQVFFLVLVVDVNRIMQFFSFLFLCLVL